MMKKLKLWYTWHRKEKLFSKFVSRNDFSTTKNDDSFVGIYVSSWFCTFIPWYNVVVGLLLKKIYNKNVAFIIDDLAYSTQELNPKYQINSIRRIGKKLKNNNVVIFLSEQSDVPIDDAVIKKYAKYNTLHDIKTEKFDDDNCYYKLMYGQLKYASYKLSSILEKYSFEYVFVPGGICFLTGIFRELLSEKKTRVCTYDSGMKGTFLLSVDGVATHHDDVPIGVMSLKKDPDFNFDYIKKNVDKLINDRFQGVDIFSSQIASSIGLKDFSNSILLPLNVNWDSAALDRHRVFDSSIDWIIETVNWALCNTNKKIIIRQHPAERFSYIKSNDDYGLLLSENFGTNPRVIYIRSDDSINTYDLLKQTDLVIVHTSTVAVEATIYGKNVISVSKTYHSKVGYIISPETKEQYFGYINALLNEPRIMNTEDYRNATISYYVSQILNWDFPDFLPSKYVESWLSSSLENIANMRGTRDLLQSVQSGVPLSIIKFKKANEQNKQTMA